MTPKKRVLVLEEEELIRDLLVARLGDKHDVVAVSTMAEARIQMRNYTFDGGAIVDGYIEAERSSTEDLVEDLLRQNVMPVIGMSGTPATNAKLAAVGCHAVFYKPVRVAAIEAMLAGSEPTSP